MSLPFLFSNSFPSIWIILSSPAPFLTLSISQFSIFSFFILFFLIKYRKWECIPVYKSIVNLWNLLLETRVASPYVRIDYYQIINHVDDDANTFPKFKSSEIDLYTLMCSILIGFRPKNNGGKDFIGFISHSLITFF